MRVALFSGNYNYVREGANQALNLLVTDLEARGHEYRVYSPVTDTPAFEPAGTLVPVPSVALPKRNEFRLALGLNRGLRADIRAFRPDIVHLSTPDILGARAQTFARALGVPVVASLHTRFETYLDHYGLGWSRRLIEAHLRRFYRRSDMVLVPNEAMAEETRGLGRPVAVWSRGVDRDRFSPARRSVEWRASQGWGESDVVVLFFGRIVLEKGVERFVETVQRLRHAGHRIHPLVVGEGPARDRFDALADTIFTGHLDGEALGRTVASADIMLSPSVTEAFGNVVLEGMASGLAVASADAPSAANLIEPGITGMLCDPANADSYLAAIGSLIADPERRRAIGAAAREASAKFSWEEASLSVERAYETVFRRAAARP
jgi:glycosyltransferase involved in cell wall biosynthesis